MLLLKLIAKVFLAVAGIVIVVILCVEVVRIVIEDHKARRAQVLAHKQ